MARALEIKTNDAELQQTLSLTNDNGETLTMNQLQTTAASLLPHQEFSLRYTDSDGDHVTITSDADVKELEKYMQDEQLQSLEVTAVPQEPTSTQRTATVIQTQLRGLVTAMAKLTAKPETKPTPASALTLMAASLEAMDVAQDSEELATIKKEVLLVLQDETFRKTVEELSATEEFKDLGDVIVTAIYQENAQAIEDMVTARFDELLVFVQRVVASCSLLKPVVVNVAKSLMTGLVRHNDQEMDGNASDSSSCSSSSSCCSDDHETVDVEVFAEEVPLHLGVGCDGCKKAPLVGVRYKSLEVPNFDLCEECEASGKHIRYEPFIKITDPSRAPKQKRTSKPVHPYVTCDGCEMSPIEAVRFKSQTKENFDLCEACEASGKWAESHGPFTKIEEPAVMCALKFTCRRGGEFDRHGKFGHHHGHGHHGKFGRHHGGKYGRHRGRHSHHGDECKHHHHGKFDHGKHHGGHGKFGRRGHCRGPPEFAFRECQSDHHGFPDHGFPFHHSRPDKFPAHDRPDFHGHPSRSPPGFDDRRHHHGPRGFGPPRCFGRFGPSPFEFTGPRVPLMCPRGFEYGRPPFPAEVDHWEHPGFRGYHGRHGRRGHHTHFSDNDEEADKQDGGKDYAHETKVAIDEDIDIVEATEVPAAPGGNAVVVNAEPKDKVDYSEVLKQLASMGFNDTEKNIFALELAGGNIGGAVNALLSE